MDDILNLTSKVVKNSGSNEKLLDSLEKLIIDSWDDITLEQKIQLYKKMSKSNKTSLKKLRKLNDR